MSRLRFTTSSPRSYGLTRPVHDPIQRYRIFGPIQPMDRPGVFQRLLELLRW